MTRPHRLCAALALFTVLACRRDPPPPAADAAPPASASAAPKEAHVDAAAAEVKAPSDPTLRVVAESIESSARAAVTADGRVVVAVGPLLYEARADGKLTPLLTAKDLAPALGDLDVLGGYTPATAAPATIAGSLDGAIWMVFRGKGFVLENGVVTPTDAAPARVAAFGGGLVGLVKGSLKRLPDGRSDLELPQKHTVFDLGTARDGVLVALAREATGRATALLFRDGKPTESCPMPSAGTCKLIPAFDGSVVVRCVATYWDEDTYEERSIARFYKLEANKWTQAYKGAPASSASGSVMENGDLVVVTSGKADVLRCPAEGKCSSLALDTSGDRKTLPPSYVEAVTDAYDRDEGRAWNAIRIETGPSASEVTESFVIARSERDVWVFTRRNGFFSAIHSSDEKERVTLPTRIDVRVTARNAKEPARWTGHCDQVFIRLPGKDGAEHAKRAAEIKAALVVGKSEDAYFEGPAATWSLVEGKLNEAPVTGVVLMRADVETSMRGFERAAEKLAEKFATGPASKPPIYCTLPVLEKRLLSGP